MATYKVSSASQLQSALNKASGGDSIVLKAGNYGTVSIAQEKYSSTVKITSESASNPAHFTRISVQSSSNITFDNIEIEGTKSSGHGTGTGFKTSSTTNITLQNSDIDWVAKGVQSWNDTNLKVINNDLNNISYDGMVIGHVHTALIQGNEVHLENTYGDNHRDVIQFYNQGSKAASSNVTIKNNLLTSDDGVAHGIYFGNNDAKSGGSSEFYKNITIENNTVKTGQVLALAMGGAQNVSIKNNVVVQTDEFYSKKTVNIPMILIDKDAKSVSLSGNTVVKAPAIADDSNNWKIVGTLSNTGSKIVSLGSSVANASTTTSSDDSATTSSSSTSAAATTTDTSSDSSSDSSSSTSSSSGTADEFRFNGAASVNHTTSATVDFSEGDVIVLRNYEDGTFQDYNGGNVVWNSSEGDYVKIDSLTDLQELAAASDSIKAKVSGDTLTLDITQDSGTHHLVLAGYGQEYLSSYDSTLF